MSCDDIRPLVDAYVDGELDITRMQGVESHLDSCESCREIVAEREAARRLVAAAPYHHAPDSLLSRITQALDLEEAAAAPPARISNDQTVGRLLRSLRIAWGSFGVAAAAAVVLGVLFVGRPSAPTIIPSDPLIADVVSAHIRSLQPGHLEDVVSTDQHTVKPWFAGRIDYSPAVVDLKDQGFPLIGGRLDYIGGRPVAALVYRHAKHLINVFVWPASGATPVQRAEQNGYHIYDWTGGGEDHYVVTDAAPGEVDRMVALLSQ